MKNRNLIALFALLITACTPKEQPIQFGADACNYCKMNIVDKQHAAEIVTKKGKAFKYDAIECMLMDKEVKEEDAAMYLVMDYNQPGTFINAVESYFLICEKIPSPMGAFLSAFKEEGPALSAKENAGTGDIYNWTGIKEQFVNQK